MDKNIMEEFMSKLEAFDKVCEEYKDNTLNKCDEIIEKLDKCINEIEPDEDYV